MALFYRDGESKWRLAMPVHDDIVTRCAGMQVERYKTLNPHATLDDLLRESVKAVLKADESLRENADAWIAETK